MKVDYELIDHTADLGIRFASPTLEGLFEVAAAALSDLLLGESTITPARTEQVSVRAENTEDLLVELLRELLYLWGVGKLAFSEANVKIPEETSLVAEVRGETFDPQRHVIANEIKAVTYHQLEVKRVDDTWHAQVIFDI
jgi:SHS2 domain-containing protein